jgi:4-hydroxythreonine-4-phosphate dehydrogenase
MCVSKRLIFLHIYINRTLEECIVLFSCTSFFKKVRYTPMAGNLPLIGITIGDPAGIGPEIAVKTCCDADIFDLVRPLLIGSRKVIEQVAVFRGSRSEVHGISDPTQGTYKRGVIDTIDIDNINTENMVRGKVQASCGRAAFEYIEKSIQLALCGALDAVTTAPINKESLKAAGVDYIGHTEIFAGLTQTSDPLTMFEVDGLRIFFLTRHLSLLQAVRAVTKDRVFEYIVRCTEALEKLGVKKGSLAVAGLNPHSGEGGLFGDEEIKHIIPAVKEARKKGYNVEGPIGADSIFHLALQGRYSGVLSLYHDQGHIAAKTYNFEKAVSITVGLPFLRTSVDHGTAFDIAGTGKASAVSMKEAVKVAARYASSYRL